MKYPLILLVVIFFASITSAQKTEDLEEWVNSVEIAFPEIYQSKEGSNLRSGSHKYDLIRYNLLSDKYFVPIFGKPFDEISELRRKKISLKLRGLERKRVAKSNDLKYPWAKRLDWYMWGVFNQSGAYNQSVEEVKALRTLRQTYKETIQMLNSDNISFDFLAGEERQVASKYKKLLPNEVTSLELLIKNRKERIANRTLLAQAEELKSLDNSYSSLVKFNNFSNKYSILFSNASTDVRKQVNAQLEAQIILALGHNAKLETERLSEMDVSELNTFSDSFNKKYRQFARYEEVKAVNAQIQRAKISQVISQLNRLEQQVAAAQNIQDLTILEQQFLSLINQSNNSQIAGLARKIENRKEAIRKTARQRLAQEEQARKLAEARAVQRHGFSNFNTSRLNNEELVEGFFRGNFVDIPFNRDELTFASLIEAYMYTYAKSCQGSLPVNRVQIMEDVCKTERVTTNGWGVETDRQCVEWVKRGTGLYADPNLYSAYNIIEGIAARDQFKNAWKLIMDMAQSNSARAINELAIEAQSFQKDMQQLIMQNGCENKALKRFEENLIQFAKNEAPIQLSGVTESRIADFSIIPQDMTRLAEDLVALNSRTWTFRYIRNSVSNVNVVSRDSQNRPKKISATYLFEGFSGRQQDVVQITFKEGVPDCIYFPNYSTDCRTPDRQVVADYLAGKYSNK